MPWDVSSVAGWSVEAGIRLYPSVSFQPVASRAGQRASADRNRGSKKETEPACEAEGANRYGQPSLRRTSVLGSGNSHANVDLSNLPIPRLG